MLSKLKARLTRSIQVVFAECDHRVHMLEDENMVLRTEMLNLRKELTEQRKRYHVMRDNLINTIEAKNEKLTMLEVATRANLAYDQQSKLLTEILFDMDVDRMNTTIRSIHSHGESLS